jgi:hypothetical protein
MTRPLYTIKFTNDDRKEVTREFMTLDRAASYAAALTAKGVEHTITHHVGAGFFNWADDFLAE